MNTNLKISAVTLAFGRAAVAGQLNLICAMSLEIAPLMEINPKFRMAQYARDVEEASGYSISRKTLENAGAVARKFNAKFGAHIKAYGDVSEANVLLFADFIKEQVAKTTYNLTVMELSAWCDGKASAADQRAAELQAKLDAQAAIVAAADKAAEAVQAQGDKAPVPAPTESAPVADAPAPTESAPVADAPAPTESAPVPAPTESAPAPTESAPVPAPKRDIYAEMLALADMLTAEDMEKFAAAMLARAAEMRAAAAPKSAPKSKSKSKRGASMAEQLEAIAA